MLSIPCLTFLDLHVVTLPGDTRFQLNIEKENPQKWFWGFWILSKQDDWSLQKIKCDFGSNHRPWIIEEIWTYTSLNLYLQSYPFFFSLTIASHFMFPDYNAHPYPPLFCCSTFPSPCSDVNFHPWRHIDSWWQTCWCLMLLTTPHIG